jgi:hypothetical protein
MVDAVRGTRRTFRELVDGTLRVIIDIDPPHRADFLALFPSVDMPCALASLLPEHQQRKEPERTERAIGPLCVLAVQWCKDPMFCDFLREHEPENWTLNGGGHQPDKHDEDVAKGVMLDVCDIESRKDLDHNELAAALFNDHFRNPYQRWLPERLR